MIMMMISQGCCFNGLIINNIIDSIDSILIPIRVDIYCALVDIDDDDDIDDIDDELYEQMRTNSIINSQTVW